jgi:hypothetical protein
VATNLEEFWVIHRPRHPIWGTVMFSESQNGFNQVNPPISGLGINLYTADEKDYLFYKYTNVGIPQFYAVTERPWLTHTVTHSMQDAIVAAKRLVPFVGQDNIRIVKVISGKLNITY